VRPETKRLISDYFFVHNKALEVGEKSVAGLALQNISREYQKMGAVRLALKTIQQSIDLLSSEHGSLNYYLSLVHRCQLFFQSGRREEALLDYESCKVASFLEIQGAVEVLKPYYEGSSVPQDLAPEVEKSLTPTWKERTLEPIQISAGESADFTRLESDLIRALSSGPKDKFELMQALYGDRLDLDVMENRLKNLLARARKKLPKLIDLEDGKYKIMDESFLEIWNRRAS
jgi:tetratricopeptide (TPR) repeat protein